MSEPTGVSASGHYSPTIKTSNIGPPSRTVPYVALHVIIVTMTSNFGNRILRSAGLLPLFLSACGLLLVLLEWMNASGTLPTEST